jgi:polyisoprenoid-binding protein YceI
MSPVQQAIPTGVYKSDPIHSSAGFAVRHMGVGRFRGEFKDFDTELRSDDGALSLEGKVLVASVAIDDENLNAHLLSPDFFDAERYPEIEFRSTDIREGDGDEVIVEGDLTIKGTTKRVQAHGELTEVTTDIGGNERVGLELETTVDRTEFGLVWNAPLPRGGFAVSNDVKLVVALELVQSE